MTLLAGACAGLYGAFLAAALYLWLLDRRMRLAQGKPRE